MTTRRYVVGLGLLLSIGCTPSTSADAGGEDDGGQGVVDAGGLDAGPDGGDPADAGGPDGGNTAELSCEIPPGGDVDEVELVQAWNAFVADESHFQCVDDDDCTIVGYYYEGGDWCGCTNTALVGKEGISVRHDAAGEAGELIAIAESEACAELRATGNWGYCDGNPPIGAVCTGGRCALEYDECGWCGMNWEDCNDAGP